MEHSVPERLSVPSTVNNQESSFLFGSSVLESSWNLVGITEYPVCLANTNPADMLIVDLTPRMHTSICRY